MTRMMEINLNASIQEKFAINEKRYPVDVVRGSAKKYDQYGNTDELT